MGKITPIGTEVAGPIAKDATNNGAQIELHAESVEHGTAVDARDGEGHLVCLECMSMLGGFHGRVHNRESFRVCLLTWTALREQGTNMKFAFSNLG